MSAKDQSKTTFTCPFGTFAYGRMPFGLCNAPATFQRCMMAIFSDFCEKICQVFMDDFSVYGSSKSRPSGLRKTISSHNSLALRTKLPRGQVKVVLD